MGVVNYKFNGIDASDVESLNSTTRSNNAIKKSGRNIIIGLAHEVNLALGTGSLTYTAPGNVGVLGNVVDWGDGTITKETSGSQSHTYATSGIYEVRYYGTASQNYAWPGNGEKVRVISIADWTNFVGSTCSSFSNLVDLPSTTQPFSTAQAFFQNCTLLNGPVDHWDTENTISTQRIFKSCSSFNQPINSWDVSNKTNFLECFRFNLAFDQPLSNWDMGSAINLSTVFQGASSFNQDIGNWRFNNTQKATGSATSTSTNQLVDSTADFVASGVSANDYVQNTTTGILSVVTGSVSATTLTLLDDIFVSGNNYRVFLPIIAPSMFTVASSFNNGGVGGLGVGLDNWTMRNVVNFASIFSSCVAFDQPIGSWDVSATTAGAGVFLTCPVFNQDIGDWETQNWTSISNMFNGARDYNNGGVGGVGLGIDKWDLSRCTNTFQVFQNAEAFDQYLGSWDVSNSTNMTHMFKSCSAFSGQGLGNWDISSCTQFDEMFFTSSNVNFAITHPNYWEINPNTTTVNGMFLGTAMNGGQASGVSGRNCEFKFSTNPADSTSLDKMFRAIGTQFNQDISTDSVNGYWEMDRVVSMSNMLASNQSFNQNIGNWNVGACTDFTSLFSGCNSFNNGGSNTINNWDVSSALSMANIFQNCQNFNQPLNLWGTKVRSVTNMSRMFENADNFDQDISGWNTSSVTTMSRMFANRDANWNYSFAGWSIASLENAQDFFSFGTKLQTVNYDAMLDSTTGWASQATIQNDVSFGVGATKYTSGGNAEAGRNILTGTYGWTITDGGPV